MPLMLLFMLLFMPLTVTHQFTDFRVFKMKQQDFKFLCVFYFVVFETMVVISAIEINLHSCLLCFLIASDSKVQIIYICHCLRQENY